MKDLDTIQRFDIIFQNIGHGISVQDKNGDLMYANQEAARLSGFSSAKQLLTTSQKKISEKFTILDKDGKALPVAKLPVSYALQHKKPRETLLRYKFNASGKESWLAIKAVPVLQGGEVRFVVNTIQDVTGSIQEAERRDYFIAMASHEFKTPLTTIKALTQILERRIKQKKYEDMGLLLDKTEKKVDELTRIINDFLDMNKIRAGKLDFYQEIFDVNTLIEETVKDFQNITSSHRIIKRGAAKRLISSDKLRIQQVVLNLLKNAVKYSPQANKVILTIDSEKDKFQVMVRDYGLGISKPYQQKIFEPFFRIPGSGSRKGLGLGLFISSQIIKRLGGKMWVEASLPNQGTTICFRLPYKFRNKKYSYSDSYKF